MAACYISEYATIAFPGPDHGSGFQAPQEPAQVEQLVGVNASSTQSAPFAGTTRMVMISLDTVASLLFGPNPTAVTTAKRLPAGFVGFFGIVPGQRVAVIANV
jgi:hypothetical protein